MSGKVVWGVLSTAAIGVKKVIPAMQKGAMSEIRAIASRDAATARRVADELGIPVAHGSYEALLADPQIEAIYNPLPNHLHVPLTIAALEAGKHVLCEKPIAIDARGARDIEAAMARTGKMAVEAFMVRHHPQWIAARDIALSGRIGDVRAISTLFCYFNVDPTNIRNRGDLAGAGGLYDIGCYAINTARWIFGAEPERVAGTLDMDPALGTDRMVSGLAEFPGGRHLTFTCATQLVPRQRVQILGTKGRIDVEVPFNQMPDIPARIFIDDGRDHQGGGIETITFDPIDQYTAQGDAVSRAIRGEGALPGTISDSIANMRVIDALLASGKSGRFERV